jgi:hypothetical protein
MNVFYQPKAEVTLRLERVGQAVAQQAELIHMRVDITRSPKGFT